MAGKQADIKVGVVTNFDGKGLEHANTGLGKFKTAVGEAEGAGGKLKAGFGAVKDTVVHHAGMIAIAGGAALVEFGIKAVEAFEHTAIAARNLGTATGLSTEAASRWIGVAKDMNVNADGLSSGLGKIAKTIDSGKWEKFGIETRDAGGHLRDTNDILLDAFTKLSETTNETERARMGMQLFGKGFASISPLIGHTRGEYEKMLGSVEKGQVITEAELKKAEKAEQAQKQLSQAFKEASLSVGAFLAQFVPLLTVVTKGVTFVSDLVGSFIDLAGGVDIGTESFKKFFEAAGEHASIKSLGEELKKMAKAADESNSFLSRLSTRASDSSWDYLNQTFRKLGKESPEAMRLVYEQLQKLREAADAGDPAAKKLADEYEITAKHLGTLYDRYIAVAPAITETERETRRLGNTMSDASLNIKDQSVALAAAAAEAGSAQRATDNLKASWDQLKSALSDQAAWIDVEKSFDDVKQKGQDAWNAAATGADDARGKMLDYQASVVDLKGKVLDFAEAVGGLPPEQVTKILAEIDAGSVTTAQQVLDEIAHDRQVIYNAQVGGHREFTQPVGPTLGAKAGGGPVTEGNWLVGEQGPEVVHMGGDGTVIPNDALGGVTITGDIHVHVQTMPTPNELVLGLAKYVKMNGPAALKALSS